MVMRELVGYRWNKIGYELIIVEAGEGFIILFIMCVKFSLMKSLKKKKSDLLHIQITGYF